MQNKIPPWIRSLVICANMIILFAHPIFAAEISGGNVRNIGALYGHLWDQTGKTVGPGYVFAIDQAGSVISHYQTEPGAGPDGGWFQLVNLPAGEEITLIGFSKKLKQYLAVEKLRVKKGMHKFERLTINYAESGFLPNESSNGYGGLVSLLLELGREINRKMGEDDALALANHLIASIEKKDRPSGVYRGVFMGADGFAPEYTLYIWQDGNSYDGLIQTKEYGNVDWLEMESIRITGTKLSFATKEKISGSPPKNTVYQFEGGFSAEQIRGKLYESAYQSTINVTLSKLSLKIKRTVGKCINFEAGNRSGSFILAPENDKQVEIFFNFSMPIDSPMPGDVGKVVSALYRESYSSKPEWCQNLLLDFVHLTN